MFAIASSKQILLLHGACFTFQYFCAENDVC